MILFVTYKNDAKKCRKCKLDKLGIDRKLEFDDNLCVIYLPCLQECKKINKNQYWNTYCRSMCIHSNSETG